MHFESSDCIRLCQNQLRLKLFGKQVLRSGTSVAANYREGSRARSDAEFISKLGIVEQELDETMLWLELLVDAGIVGESKLNELIGETDQLLRITVTSIRNTKSRIRNKKSI